MRARGCGGTGRHATFRSSCSKGRGGSNPLSRTFHPESGRESVAKIARNLPLSSRGLGRRILSPETGVRIPVAVLRNLAPGAGFRRSCGRDRGHVPQLRCRPAVPSDVLGNVCSHEKRTDIHGRGHGPRRRPCNRARHPRLQRGPERAAGSRPIPTRPCWRASPSWSTASTSVTSSASATRTSTACGRSSRSSWQAGTSTCVAATEPGEGFELVAQLNRMFPAYGLRIAQANEHLLSVSVHPDLDPQRVFARDRGLAGDGRRRARRAAGDDRAAVRPSSASSTGSSRPELGPGQVPQRRERRVVAVHPVDARAGRGRRRADVDARDAGRLRVEREAWAQHRLHR